MTSSSSRFSLLISGEEEEVRSYIDRYVLYVLYMYVGTYLAATKPKVLTTRPKLRNRIGRTYRAVKIYDDRMADGIDGRLG